MRGMQLVLRYLQMEQIAVSSDRLLYPGGDDPAQIPRVYVVTVDEGRLLFVRNDLPQSLRQRLLALGPEQVFHQRAAVGRLLEEQAPVTEIWMGKSYVADRPLDEVECGAAVRLEARHQPLIERYEAGLSYEPAVYAVIVDGRICATCQSTRENEVGAEAWVRTLPECRRRGYARQVTAAWARRHQREGRLPFYSHRWDNAPSEALAQSLRFTQFMIDLAYH